MSNALPHRVVFVDDDPLVLRSLKRSMSRKLGSWDLVFASDGDAALEAMAEGPVDVLISDLNMGRMDGEVLLRRVQQDAPEVVRIILSGSTSRREACLTTPVAHQFLAKPIGADELTATLRRAVEIRMLLDNPALKKLVAGSNELPSVPALYRELTQLFRREDAALHDAAELVERDPALAARILQMTCSAFVGRRTPPRTVREAVVFIGMSLLESLVLTHHIVTMFKVRVSGFSVEGVQEHGVRTARLVTHMLAGTTHVDAGFMVGMLHGVGKLVLASRTPKAYASVLAAQRMSGGSLPKVELDLLGASHAEIGAYLLGIWGLPQPVIDAVAYCHRPDAIEDKTLGLASAAYLASRLADDPDTPVCDCSRDHHHLDARLVELLGVADAVAQWRAFARGMQQ